MNNQLPIPSFYTPENVSKFWRVPYDQRAQEARQWAEKYHLQPAADDKFRIGLLLVDVQNTFCLPDFELFVGGRSGKGAVEDNQRLCDFIYRNLGRITGISATLDTHRSLQIFHPAFFINQDGEHPQPYTLITAEDVRQGVWKVNPAVATSLGKSQAEAQEYLAYYTHQLDKISKYSLTVWPYHAMLGGIGHSLVSAVEEALFFHSIARYAQINFVIKGNQPWTEAYSAIGPEVSVDAQGNLLAEKNREILAWLQTLDILVVAGQAKSHCVAWTMEDLLAQIQETDPRLAHKIYLLDDCSSPVVVPGVIDYTNQANASYQHFADQGVRIVKSTTPIEEWPGVANLAEQRV
jgi:nicotinamidase-related amidase